MLIFRLACVNDAVGDSVWHYFLITKIPENLLLFYTYVFFERAKTEWNIFYSVLALLSLIVFKYLLDKTTTTYMLYNCVLRQCLISTPLVLIPGISKGEQLWNISFSLPRNLTKVDDCYQTSTNAGSILDYDNLARRGFHLKLKLECDVSWYKLAKIGAFAYYSKSVQSGKTSKPLAGCR